MIKKSLFAIKKFLYKEHYTIKGVQKILRLKHAETSGNLPTETFIEEMKEIRRFLSESLPKK